MKIKKMMIPGMIVFSMMFIAGTIMAAPKSQEEMAKIHAERMQLESAKKKAIQHCESFKNSNPENYSKCMGMEAGSYEAEIRLLMEKPDIYFDKKQKKGPKKELPVR